MRMMINTTVVLVLIVSILKPETELIAKTITFNSESIRELFQSLPVNYQKTISELQNTKSQSFNIKADNIIPNRYLKLRFNEYDELVHIGLLTFESEIKDRNYLIVLEYLERTFLTFGILKQNSLILQMMQRENIQILINGAEVDQKTTQPIISLLNNDLNIAFQLLKENKSITATWTINEYNYFKLIFPNSIFVISGKDKYELENELVRDLRFIPSGEHTKTNPSKKELMTYAKDVLVLKGESYSQIPDISSDIYFNSKESISPVYDSKAFFESVNNLFLNVIPTNTNFNLKYKLYDDRSEHYIIKLNTFFSFFTQEHKLYVGWQSREIGEMKVSVFIFNPFFEYSHLLTISFDEDDIFGNNKHLNTLFYAYTPQINLKIEK